MRGGWDVGAVAAAGRLGLLAAGISGSVALVAPFWRAVAIEGVRTAPPAEMVVSAGVVALMFATTFGVGAWLVAMLAGERWRQEWIP